MSIESRSIDFAKTASIDMMALNNKVVNMRQVVKRTKVQVINKLCKNIASLKKKKGTEEQKTQNLRKAERLIEEIDSIKRLKEDKVSKYSLGNTMSFTDVCKASLSAGPRAMARLADHPLMQKMVGDFRTQHQDWRDLAAYLLIKQTGRRFKTKKQKQRKKLSRSVENIVASETMTKAYIQERFGEDGLKKAELRFERKRKRAPFDKRIQAEDTDEENSTEPTIKTKRKNDEIEVDSESKVRGEDDGGSDGDRKDSSDISDKEMPENASSGEDTKFEKSDVTGRKTKMSKSSPSKTDPEGRKSEVVEANNSTLSSTKIVEKSVLKKLKSSQDLSKKPNKAFVEEPKTIGSDSEVSSGDESATDVQESTKRANQITSTKEKSECVVKELDIDKSDNYYFDEESSAESSEEEEANLSSNSYSNDDVSSQRSPDISNRQKKKVKVRGKKVPPILTNKSQKAVSDPFFAGSGDEDEEEDAPNDFDKALLLEPGDDEGIEFNTVGNRSMFYNPHGEEVYRKGVKVPTQGWPGSREGNRWQRQERGRGWGRGGSFSGQQRGRGMSLGGTQVRGFRGASRGGHPGGSQGFGGPRLEDTQRKRPERIADTPLQTSGEKLHPSWEASKKRKAEQSGIQAFKGSKITFDDDD